MPSPPMVEIGSDVYGKSTSLIYSLLQFLQIDEIFDSFFLQFFEGELEKVRDPMINILVDFYKDVSFFKPYFDGLIDDIYRSANWNYGIEMKNILWIKTDTSMGDQTSNCPWEVSAVDSITAD